MTAVLWIVIALAGAALVAAAAAAVRKRSTGPSELDTLVRTAFGEDWTHRPNATTVANGEAGTPAVELTFARGEQGGTDSRIKVVLEYTRPDGSTTSAELRVPWEGLPQDVRAELIHAPRSAVVRNWTPK